MSYLSSSPWRSYPPRGCKQFKISNTAAPAHAEQNTWPWDTWTHPPLISADQPGPHVRVHRGDSKYNCSAAPAPGLPPRFCSGCLRVEQPGWPLLFACWSCRDTYYCNGECQLRAWNEKGTWHSTRRLPRQLQSCFIISTLLGAALTMTPSMSLAGAQIGIPHCVCLESCSRASSSAHYLVRRSQ